MRRTILTLAIVGALVPGLSWGQSMPQIPNGAGGFISGLYYGFLASADDWNRFFQAKQDWPLPASTVAGLTPCTSANANSWAVVTDATSPTYNGAPAGSGAVIVPVFCNGSAWKTH